MIRSHEPELADRLLRVAFSKQIRFEYRWWELAQFTCLMIDVITDDGGDPVCICAIDAELLLTDDQLVSMMAHHAASVEIPSDAADICPPVDMNSYE